jgi:5'-nucleotidase
VNEVRVLITNDDGIASPGLHTLAQVAVDAGLDVLVAAPSWDSSGASASLTAVEDDGKFVVREQTLPGLDGVPALAVEAAPAFIVWAAVHGAFGDPPDLVLSGINRGPNTGRAVLHSGTVGAALTAITHGRPAAAFSIGIGDPTYWETAGHVVGDVLGWLLATGVATVLNVNVPNVPIDDLRGIAPAALSRVGAVQANVTEVGKGYVKLAYSAIDAEHEPGTDAALLAQGVATVTPLLAVCEAEGVDVSDLVPPLVGHHAQGNGAN